MHISQAAGKIQAELHVLKQKKLDACMYKTLFVNPITYSQYSLMNNNSVTTYLFLDIANIVLMKQMIQQIILSNIAQKIINNH